MAEFMSGFEAGTSPASGFSQHGTVTPNITSSPRSGSYCGRANPTGSGVGYFQANRSNSGGSAIFTAPFAIRFAFRANTLPAANTEGILQATGNLTLRINSAGVLSLWSTAPANVANGSTVLAPGTWYVIEAFIPASGTAKIRIYADGEAPGADEVTIADTSTATASVLFGKATNNNNQTVSFDYDDIHILDGVSDYYGDGKIIAVRGNSATPTHDGFTKSTAGGISTCWNDVPTSAGTYASTTINADLKQTIAHDATGIGASDVIKAVQTVLVGFRGIFGNYTLEELHRFGGTDHTATIDLGQLSASFAYSIWASNPSSVAELDAAEAGVFRHGDWPGSLQINDLWIEVDYAPAAPEPPPGGGGGGEIALCVPPVVRDADPNLLAQFQAPSVGLIFLFEGRFLNSTLYLWTGAGELEWDGKVWLGAGSLIGISQAKESSDLTAVGLTVSLSGIDGAIISAALQELRQGQVCRVYIGSYQWYPTRGLLSTPYCFFDGRVDVPTIDDSANSAVVSLQLENRLVDFERQRVRFYDPQTQNVYFPGDRGFDYVAALQDQKIFWGKSN